MSDYVKGWLMLGGFIALVLTGHPFAIGLVAIAEWAIYSVVLTVYIKAVEATRDPTAEYTGEQYTKYVTMLENLSRPFWERLIGIGATLWISFSLYNHGWTITAYAIVFALILSNTLRPAIKKQVNDIIAHKLTTAGATSEN